MANDPDTDGGPASQASWSETEWELAEVLLQQRLATAEDWLGAQRAKQLLPRALARGGTLSAATLAAIPAGSAGVVLDAGPAWVKPPEAPSAAQGLVSAIVEVGVEGALDKDVFGLLIVTSEPKLLPDTAPETLRLFRHDEQATAWQLVSGSNTDGHFVWGRIAFAGLYGVAGLPADPLLFMALKALHAMRSLLRSADDALRGRLVDDVAGAILRTAPGSIDIASAEARSLVLRQTLADGAAVRSFDWSGDLPDYAAWIKRLSGLSYAVWPPEFQLLDEEAASGAVT